MDRLDAMRLFIRVADTGSFSKAAADLDVGQPTVSRRIQDLEAQLGADLTVKSFEYELPGGQVHRELDVKIPGAQAALDQAEKKFEGEFEDAAKVADQPGEKAADGRLKDAIGTFEKVAKDAFEKNKASKKSKK